MNSLKIKTSDFVNWTILILYRICLDYIYVDYLVDRWWYMGFIIKVDGLSYLLSWIVFAFMIEFINQNLRKHDPSSFIMVLLNLIAFIPATTMLGLYPQDNYFALLITLFWLALNCMYNIIPKFRIVRTKNKESNLLFKLVIVFFIISVWIISYRYTGLRINLNLLNVYDLREEAMGFEMPTLITYIISAARIIIPTAMIYYLYKKRYLLFSFLLLTGILVFSINGQRSVLFTILLAIGGFFFYKNNILIYVPSIFLGVSILSIIEYKISSLSYIIDIFIRRVLFLPQLLNYYYYDFFSKNSFDYFRQGLLSGLGVESPYDENISIMIGNLYLGGNTNNGLFSDAYANFGFFGMILMPLLIVLALKVLDSVSKGIDNRLLIACIIMLTMNFLSSSFFVVMLTHGFIAVCILLYLIPRETKV